jgi:hypothetical protein
MSLISLNLRHREPLRVSRAGLLQRPVLLTEIYSFARSRSHLGSVWIELQIKLMLILGRELTFAGSTLLNDPLARTIFERNVDFFREGLIIPDLEVHVSGFEHRLLKYKIRGSRRDRREYARRLDDSVRSVISFEPTEVSADYVNRLTAYARFFASEVVRKSADEQIEAVIAAIQETKEPLSLPTVTELSKHFPDPKGFKRIGEFLYCYTGADVVGADALYSHHYKQSQMALGNFDNAGQANLELVAARSLFTYFAVDWQKIAILPPTSIMKLRDDARIRTGVNTLRALIQEARQRTIKGIVDAGGDRLLSEASDELRIIIEEACTKQAKREGMLNLSSDLVFDAIPMSSLAKRGLTKLEGWLAGTKFLGGMSRPLAPLTTFASLVQKNLKGASAEEHSRN